MTEDDRYERAARGGDEHSVLVAVPVGVEGFRPYCSCGWRGERWAAEQSAATEGGEHYFENARGV